MVAHSATSTITKLACAISYDRMPCQRPMAAGPVLCLPDLQASLVQSRGARVPTPDTGATLVPRRSAARRYSCALPASQSPLPPLQHDLPGRYVLRWRIPAPEGVSPPVGKRFSTPHPAPGDGLPARGTHPGYTRATDARCARFLHARRARGGGLAGNLSVPASSPGVYRRAVRATCRRCPLGSASTRCVHRWHGYAWEESCPPLGGKVLVSLAVALPPGAPSPFASLLIGWTVLARAMRAVL